MYLDGNMHTFQVEKNQNSEDSPFNRIYTKLNKYIILGFILSGTTA